MTDTLCRRVPFGGSPMMFWLADSGVSRRPSDTLYFGNTASSILDNSPTSNLFVAS